MTSISEPAVKIAKKLKMDKDEVGESLEKMANDGLLFRLQTSETPLYMCNPILSWGYMSGM